MIHYKANTNLKEREGKLGENKLFEKCWKTNMEDQVVLLLLEKMSFPPKIFWRYLGGSSFVGRRTTCHREIRRTVVQRGFSSQHHLVSYGLFFLLSSPTGSVELFSAGGFCFFFGYLLKKIYCFCFDAFIYEAL